MHSQDQELSFEEAMKRLEKIVKALESDNISLEDSIRLYEEGMSLSRYCMKSLEEAEKKILILKENEKGQPVYEEFSSKNQRDDIPF